MPLGLVFWILMLLWVILATPGPWVVWPTWPGHVLLFLLLLVLGWHNFGPPLRG